MRFFIPLAIGLLAGSTGQARDLPDRMRCAVSGHASCVEETCIGAGTTDPSLRLSISRSAHMLALNGITAVIDERDGDPYGVGAHRLRWKRELIAYTRYEIGQPDPGRVFITLSRGDAELEFHCLGRLNARQPQE